MNGLNMGQTIIYFGPESEVAVPVRLASETGVVVESGASGRVSFAGTLRPLGGKDGA